MTANHDVFDAVVLGAGLAALSAAVTCNEGYGGGLCLAVVFGRRAGQLAALRASKEVEHA